MPHAMTALVASGLIALGASCCQAQSESSTGELTQEGIPKLDVGYVKTPKHVVDLMLHMAGVKKDDLLYDLGCGDGRIVVTAAQRYGCRAIGVDIDPARVRESRENVKAAGVERLVTIKQQDLLEIDLRDADVVMMFLTPKLNVSLIPQFQQMKPGARIVSHKWDMQGIDPDAVVNVYRRDYDDTNDVYLWETPLKQVGTTEDSPIVSTQRLSETQEANDLWSYVFQHAFQRWLLVIVIALLAIAATVGIAQARKHPK